MQVYWHQANRIFLIAHNSSSVTLGFTLQYNVVSSAYINMVKMLLTKGKSLIYIRNNKGPKTDP